MTLDSSRSSDRSFEATFESNQAVAMRLVRYTLVVLGFAVSACKGGASASDKPTAAECAALADHLLNALLAEARSKKPELSSLGPSQQGMLDWAQHEAGKKIEAKCTSEFTRERYTCVMAAQTEAELQACDDKAKAKAP
jgi:hypothetical protein